MFSIFFRTCSTLPQRWLWPVQALKPLIPSNSPRKCSNLPCYVVMLTHCKGFTDRIYTLPKDTSQSARTSTSIGSLRKVHGRWLCSNFLLVRMLAVSQWATSATGILTSLSLKISKITWSQHLVHSLIAHIFPNSWSGSCKKPSEFWAVTHHIQDPSLLGWHWSLQPDSKCGQVPCQTHNNVQMIWRGN